MDKSAQKSYPPSHDSRFIVGRDTQGCWVVCDQRGLVGGLFANKDSAIHFAIFESDHVPGAVCFAPEDAIVTLAGLQGGAIRLPQQSSYS